MHHAYMQVTKYKDEFCCFPDWFCESVCYITKFALSMCAISGSDCTCTFELFVT